MGRFTRTRLSRLAGACLLTASLSAGAANLEDWWIYVRNDQWHQLAPLIEKGADPNRVSPQGQPTLVEAVRTKAWKTYEALLRDPRIKIDAANNDGETALMLLSVLGETARVRDLLDRGAQVNKLGWTPLHYAASKGRVDIAKLLIARKAIINAPSPDGTTPLMMAALSKNEEMVKLLISAGADPTTRNLSNLNAADWARSSNADAIAKQLDTLVAQRERDRGQSGASVSGRAVDSTTGQPNGNAAGSVRPEVGVARPAGDSTLASPPRDARIQPAAGEPSPSGQRSTLGGVSNVRIGND